MSKHLSDEQFAECFVASARSAELLRHVRECESCSEELERFGATVVSLRTAIRSRVEQAEAIGAVAPRRFRPAANAPVPRWQWIAGVAAVVLFGLIPVVTLETKEPIPAREETAAADAAAAAVLMDSINLHLSRDLPAPMEPLMVIPDNEFVIDSGGVQ
jgi:hypothetical protein